MDYTVLYLYKDFGSNLNDKAILEILDIEEIHYVLHIHSTNLNLIDLNDLSQTELTKKQLLSNIGKNNQRFPQTFTIGLESLSVSCSYNEVVHELFILDDAGQISTISKKELNKR